MPQFELKEKTKAEICWLEFRHPHHVETSYGGTLAELRRWISCRTVGTEYYGRN